MKILKISSTLKSFREIEFNENGFSFILGEKDINNETYNGTGKTLSLSIIDFCLGSNKKEELEKLDCMFMLKIKHNQKTFIISRHTKDQNFIYIDGEKYKLTKFREKLCDEFGMDTKKFVTFRTKIALNIRYKKSSFNNPLDPGDGGTEFQHLLNIFDELNFDLDYLYKKHSINEELSLIKKVTKELKNKDIKEVLTDSSKDIDMEKKRLLVKIEEKKRMLSTLRVSENVFELKKELMETRTLFNDSNNKITLLEKNKKKIENSLKENIFLSEKIIVEKYNEFKELFDEKITKTLNDVLTFHNELVEKRYSRLGKQLQQITTELNESIKLNNIYKDRIDNIYSELKDTIDLNELKILFSEITQLELQLQKINTYQNVLTTQNSKKLVVENNFSLENIISQNYIDLQENKIDEICDAFNYYAFTMYNNQIDSYIKITNNTNINSIRYNIDVKIPNDGSDGIQNAKIMCFDLMLKKISHSPFEFIIHDNKIFYGLDFETVAKLFKKLYSDSPDFQYIITLNKSDYNEIKKEMNDDKLFRQIVDDNIKIYLKPDSKLLGMNIDLKVKE